MSDQAITRELVGGRLMALTADMRDLQQRVGSMQTRFSALERRFSALENRFSGLARMDGIEDRMGRPVDRIGQVLSLIVRTPNGKGCRNNQVGT